MIEIAKEMIVETGHQGSNNSIVWIEEGLVLIDSPFRPTDAVAANPSMSTLGYQAPRLPPFLQVKGHRRSPLLDAGLAWAGQIQGLIGDAPTCKGLINLVVIKADDIFSGCVASCHKP